MKKNFGKLCVGGVFLISLSMSLTSCDDILGEWSRPTPNPVTPGGGTATVTSISIDPTLALKVGETGQLTATVDPAGTAVTWSSDQEAIATVDANGLVTAKADGTATITAKAGDKSASCTVTVTEYAANEYNEGSWDSTNEKVIFTKQTAASVTAVANSDADVTWSAGWYTVSGNVTIGGDVTLMTNVHLILQDGATLTINGQLDCGVNNNLYIYGQKKGDGKLNVNETNTSIAISNDLDYRIEIHGGEVTAEATGNFGLYTGYLAVYGGKLTATSGSRDGIGFENTIDVYGGEVVATSNATSSSYARYGIISGGLNTQILKVYGGKVTATGNGKESSGDYGSGFGCYVWSATTGIKFYFSDDGTTWGSGFSYGIANSVGLSTSASDTKKRYAKAE